jgi:hypothetical protein
LQANSLNEGRKQRWILKASDDGASILGITGFLDLHPSSDILKNINTTFQKLDLFAFSGE